MTRAATVEHDVADLGLAPHGRSRIEWSDRAMPVLRSIRERFAVQRPLEGVRIAACLHITTETANLVRTLQAGGAQVRLAASNPLSTQDDTAAALVAEYGVSVYARHRTDPVTYRRHIDAVLGDGVDFVLDDACDLVNALHADYADLLPTIRGGCEETNTGVVRLRAMAASGVLKFPMVAVTDTVIKTLSDNRYGTGQSTVDALLRATNLLVAGSTAVVAGFGPVGMGIAERLAGMGARVIVTEVDPARALAAVMGGYRVHTMAEAAPLGDIFVTATGNRDVITAEHFAVMRDGALLANAGHFDVEIDVSWLTANATGRTTAIRPNVDEFLLPSGGRVLLIADGRVANLAAAEGHPAAVMDMAFGLQALTAEWMLRAEPGTVPPGVYEVPVGIDREVARLALGSLGVSIDALSDTQREYLTAWG